MEETNNIATLLYCAAVIVIGTWFFFMVRCTMLCYKHDSYIKKHFLNLSGRESVSFFGGNWSGLRFIENVLPSKTAPDENISLMRKEIRRSWFGILLGISLFPGGLFLLVLLFFNLKSQV